MKNLSNNLVNDIFTLLDENKAETIKVYDVREKVNYCDDVVIACGNSIPHLKAIYEKVRTFVKSQGVFPLSPSKGVRDNPWLILDFGDIIVHLLLKVDRLYYRLDEMFSSDGMPYPEQKDSPKDNHQF